jgi:hypothetical protein
MPAAALSSRERTRSVCQPFPEGYETVSVDDNQARRGLLCDGAGLRPAPAIIM